MVWDPPKKEVNVTRMIIYSFIPILSIYAGWRIQKFLVLLGINILLGMGASTGLQMMLPFPYGLIISIAGQVIASFLIVKHFAEKYNEKIKASSCS